MKTAADTLLRQWVLLQGIPRYPGRRSTGDLVQRLREEGYQVTKRTVERDLEKLSAVFPFTCEAENRRHHWFWPPKTGVWDIPSIDPATALAFNLAHDYLAPLLPPATLALLDPHFERAAQMLANAESSALARWQDRVRVLTRGPWLTPPMVDSAVQAAICEGLLTGRQLEMLYQPREAEAPKLYVLNPEGLVVREGVLYVVGTLWSYRDIKHFALHRVRSARLLDTLCEPLKSFNLDRYIREEAGFSYAVSDKRLRLRALFDPAAAYHLRERSLAEDQRLTDQTDGRVLLQVTVADTAERGGGLEPSKAPGGICADCENNGCAVSVEANRP